MAVEFSDIPVVGGAFEFISDAKEPVFGVTTGIVGGALLGNTLVKLFGIADTKKAFLLKAMANLAAGGYVLGKGIERDSVFVKSMGVGFGVAVLLEVVKTLMKRLGIAVSLDAISLPVKPTIAQLINFSQAKVAEYPAKPTEVTFAGGEEPIEAIV